MTLKQLEYFVTVIDCGSISGAAKMLHVSQPPLSMQIKALEDEFGTLLLERNTRHFRPTDAGHRLYDRAREILDLAHATEDELSTSEENIEGKLIIGTISSCGNVLLTPGFSRFSREYPKINFELVEGTTFIMLDKLKKREIDLAFLRTPFDDDGLSCKYFSSEPMCAVGSKNMLLPASNNMPLPGGNNLPLQGSQNVPLPGKENLPLPGGNNLPLQGSQRSMLLQDDNVQKSMLSRDHDSQKSMLSQDDDGLLNTPITLEELSRKPLIVYRRFEDLIRTTFRSRGLGISIKCLNDDARTSLMWASAGIGVCLIPESISSLITGPDLIRRKIACEDFTTHVAIACRQGQYLSPAARKFLEVFEKETR